MHFEHFGYGLSCLVNIDPHEDKSQFRLNVFNSHHFLFQNLNYLFQNKPKQKVAMAA